MQIGTKYSPGDKIWVINQEYKAKPLCPHCGAGNLENLLVPRLVTITRVAVDVGVSDTKFLYWVEPPEQREYSGLSGMFYTLDKLFDTEAEALEDIKKQEEEDERKKVEEILNDRG